MEWLHIQWWCLQADKWITSLSSTRTHSWINWMTFILDLAWTRLTWSMDQSGVLMILRRCTGHSRISSTSRVNCHLPRLTQTYPWTYKTICRTNRATWCLRLRCSGDRMPCSLQLQCQYSTSHPNHSQDNSKVNSSLSLEIRTQMLMWLWTWTLEVTTESTKVTTSWDRIIMSSRSAINVSHLLATVTCSKTTRN